MSESSSDITMTSGGVIGDADGDSGEYSSVKIPPKHFCSQGVPFLGYSISVSHVKVHIRTLCTCQLYFHHFSYSVYHFIINIEV